MSFDMDHAEGLAQLQKELAAMLPGYTIDITPDVDVSDLASGAYMLRTSTRTGMAKTLKLIKK